MDAGRVLGRSQRILEVRLSENKHELTVVVSHWTSRVSDKAGKGRNNYARVIHADFQAAYRKNAAVDYLVCGDFNDTPSDDAVERELGAVGDLNQVLALGRNDRPLLFNPFAALAKQKKGTHYFGGSDLAGLAVYDPTLGVLQARAADGRVIATLVQWANHPESTLNWAPPRDRIAAACKVLGWDGDQCYAQGRYLTADYPGALARWLGRRIGGEVVYVNGAIGAMASPLDVPAWEVTERTPVGDGYTVLRPTRTASCSIQVRTASSAPPMIRPSPTPSICSSATSRPMPDCPHHSTPG